MRFLLQSFASQQFALFFILAAKNKWPLYQMDIVTAFLNGMLQEDIFMEIPEGFLARVIHPRSAK
jgi:hypothetical protein